MDRIVSSFDAPGEGSRLGRVEDGAGSGLISATQIGQANRRLVLQMLFDKGPTSRADLARLTVSKRTTITGIVQPMLDSGLLVECDPAEERGVGKPARPLWFSPSAPPVCAVVLMPDKVESALISLTGESSAHRSVSIPPGNRKRAVYIEALSSCIAASLAEAKGTAMGIGVAVGGMVEPDEGTIMAMNLAPEMAGLDLAGELVKRTGLDTVVDHHPRAILLGERWFGEGRGLRDFAVIYADEVLGCAVYTKGRPFRGPHGAGGELGHMIVDRNGSVCTCGRRGCWETIATLPWLRRRAEELGLPGAATLEVAQLVQASATDASANGLLDEYIENLALGISNLQTLMMPGEFIIYGAARSGKEVMQARLAAALERMSRPFVPQKPRVLIGKDQQATTLRGAAGLVISKKLEISY